MAKFEFFLDKEDVEQARILSELAQFNARVRGEVIRHAFVAVNTAGIDLSFRNALKEADLIISEPKSIGDFNIERFEKIMLLWHPSIIPVSLHRIMHEVRVISKSSRYQYLLALFLIGNRIINGKFNRQQTVPATEFKSDKTLDGHITDQAPIPERAEPIKKQHALPSTQPSNPKNIKAALGGLMKRQ